MDASTTLDSGGFKRFCPAIVLRRCNSLITSELIGEGMKLVHRTHTCMARSTLIKSCTRTWYFKIITANAIFYSCMKTSAPVSRSQALGVKLLHTHTHTLTLTHALIHSLHPLFHSLTRSLPHAPSLDCSLARSLAHSPTHALAH